MAVGANRVALQVDGCPAVAAVHTLHVLFELLHLLRGEHADEILLFQEIEKPDKSPVSASTGPIDEPHIPDHVVRQRQPPTASRAPQHFRQGCLGR